MTPQEVKQIKKGDILLEKQAIGFDTYKVTKVLKSSRPDVAGLFIIDASFVGSRVFALLVIRKVNDPKYVHNMSFVINYYHKKMKDVIADYQEYDVDSMGYGNSIEYLTTDKKSQMSQGKRRIWDEGNKMSKAQEILNLMEMALPKNEWVDAKFEDLDPGQMDTLWDMYQKTYAPIGLTVADIRQLKKKYEVSMLVDLDDDPNPDAFIIYKIKPMGRKLALMGSDGTKPAKRALIAKCVEVLKTKGYYIEASHKVMEILIAKGVPMFDDPEKVKKILKKDITWKGDGWYSRFIGGVGEKEKRLLGTV